MTQSAAQAIADSLLDQGFSEAEVTEFLHEHGYRPTRPVGDPS